MHGGADAPVRGRPPDRPVRTPRDADFIVPARGEASYRLPAILIRISSNSLNLAGSATGRGANRSPSSMVTALFASNAGHLGRPGPLGSPLLTKFAQYEDVVSAIERSTASHGRFALPRLLNTYGSSAEWKAW